MNESCKLPRVAATLSENLNMEDRVKSTKQKSPGPSADVGMGNGRSSRIQRAQDNSDDAHTSDRDNDSPDSHRDVANILTGFVRHSEDNKGSDSDTASTSSAGKSKVPMMRSSRARKIPLHPDAKKRRGNLPRETTNVLKAWLMAHTSNPYPTDDQKHELAKRLNLTLAQISNWFINARRRIVTKHKKNDEPIMQQVATFQGQPNTTCGVFPQIAGMPFMLPVGQMGDQPIFNPQQTQGMGVYMFPQSQVMNMPGQFPMNMNYAYAMPMPNGQQQFVLQPTPQGMVPMPIMRQDQSSSRTQGQMQGIHHVQLPAQSVVEGQGPRKVLRPDTPAVRSETPVQAEASDADTNRRKSFVSHTEAQTTLDDC